MDKRKLGALALTGAGVLALIGCGPPRPTNYKACSPAPPAGVIFTVKLPVMRSEAEARICQPGDGQRLDVLVPPLLPGSGAASQTEQINLMGGVQIPPMGGDPEGYARGRTVIAEMIPLVGG